jgi:hypothetical protein
LIGRRQWLVPRLHLLDGAMAVTEAAAVPLNPALPSLDAILANGLTALPPTLDCHKGGGNE